MQVILQKGRHAPWKIFLDKSLVSFSAIVASPSGASVVAPPPTHWWDFCHRWCTCKNYNVNNKYKMEFINYPTPPRERRAANNCDTNVAAIGVVRNERGRSQSRKDQGGRRQVPDGSARDSVAIALAVAFAAAAVVSCSTAGCRVDASASHPLDSASARANNN
jgi:hypothetical protein